MGWGGVVENGELWEIAEREEERRKGRERLVQGCRGCLVISGGRNVWFAPGLRGIFLACFSVPALVRWSGQYGQQRSGSVLATWKLLPCLTVARQQGQVHAVFVWLISHLPAVLLSQNKSATNNQPTVVFSQNKPAPATSQTDRLPPERNETRTKIVVTTHHERGDFRHPVSMRLIASAI
jgi:hypothetical protein